MLSSRDGRFHTWCRRSRCDPLPVRPTLSHPTALRWMMLPLLLVLLLVLLLLLLLSLLLLLLSRLTHEMLRTTHGSRTASARGAGAVANAGHFHACCPGLVRSHASHAHSTDTHTLIAHHRAHAAGHLGRSLVSQARLARKTGWQVLGVWMRGLRRPLGWVLCQLR